MLGGKVHFFGHLKYKCTRQIYTMENGELHYMIGFFSIFDFTKIIIRLINYSFLFLNLK